MGLYNNSIVIMDRTTHRVVNIINSSYFNSIRDIIFLKKGEIMGVTSVYLSSLVFLKRMNSSQANYTFFLGASGFYGYLCSFTQLNNTFWQIDENTLTTVDR